MEAIERANLMAELDEAKRDLTRCMGKDQQGIVNASRRIAELRNKLRDDASLFAHFAKVGKNATAAKNPRA